ncbi:hypothetical protein [Roseimarinus sediminis]|uniref:hypothetical protein n=1 Tax=Roseimarinus sediminis TaxID=1610899 RepID=UPI003D1D78BE
MLSENKQKIIDELEDLSRGEEFKVLNYIRTLKKSSYGEGLENAIVSEPSLAAEWNTREEDEAWKDL